MFAKRLFALSTALLLLASTNLFAAYEQEILQPNQSGTWTRWPDTNEIVHYDDLTIYMHGGQCTVWGTFDFTQNFLAESERIINKAKLVVYFERPANYPEERPFDSCTITAGTISMDITDPECQCVNAYLDQTGTISTESFFEDTENNLLYCELDIMENPAILEKLENERTTDKIVSFGLRGIYEPENDPISVHSMELRVDTYPDFDSPMIQTVATDNGCNFHFFLACFNTHSDENPIYVRIEAKCPDYNNGEYVTNSYFLDHLTTEASGDGSSSFCVSAKDLLGSDDFIAGLYSFRIAAFLAPDCIDEIIQREWNEHDFSYELGAEEAAATALPTTTKICGAYPNPFNGMTTVNFQLHKTSNVSMKLYDIQGRLVSELMNQQVTAGAHVQSLELSNLTSGTYFVRMKANDSVYVEKIMLLK